jgi:hypothetical protein
MLPHLSGLALSLEHRRAFAVLHGRAVWTI